VLESGSYIFLSTDRVTFNRVEAGVANKDSAQGPARESALPVDEVPSVVFSEVMRHCDLFTAVASIASDPNWVDRGSDAEHPNRWRREAMEYAARERFADLTEAARIRRSLLGSIVPRLAIADRCSFDDRALIVRGKRHSYRIHIGSAAVALLPHMRHLCIIPAPSARWQGGNRIYLPFTGDQTLSVIISKAILLADDDKITDKVILSQLA
jgi:hypothetical protein